jgi:hypothetical protein
LSPLTATSPREHQWAAIAHAVGRAAIAFQAPNRSAGVSKKQAGRQR